MTDYQKATCWWLAAFFLAGWTVAAGEGGLAYTPAVIAAVFGALYLIRQFFREGD
jgi:hypothetical protein